MTRILAITGSLRAASRNTSVLLAAARLVPDGATVDLLRELDSLPHFNPDLEASGAPPAVATLRARLAAADALLVCSPEYAHGVPGALKNALDWWVGVGLGRRPVGIVNASPASTHAHAQLREILATMDGVLVEPAVIVLPLAGRDAGPEALLASEAIAGALRGCVDSLVAAGRAWRAAVE